MNRRTAFAAAIVVVGTIAVGVLLTHRNSASSEEVRGMPRDIAASRPAVGAGTHGVVETARQSNAPFVARALGDAPRLAVPVPPKDSPIKDVIAALKAEADRGVPEAACRIGEELTRCLNARVMLGAKRNELAAMNKAPGGAAEHQLLALTNRYAAYDRATELCEGIDDQTLGSAWRYLLSAAQGGSVPAMAQFAIAPPLSRDNIVADIDGWAAYQQFAPAMLTQAIDRGDVRALFSGWFQAASGLSAGGRSATPNPRLAIVYGTAAMGVVDSDTRNMIRASMPRLEQQVGSDQVAAARAEGAALASKSFAQATPTNVSAKVGEAQPMACHGEK